jgi:regulator of cell morphogenesis and NO signaling
MNESKKPRLQDMSGRTIGEIVAENYRSAAVFDKYGIDFCCGGQATLSAACQEKGLDPAEIAREIEVSKSGPTLQSENYTAWELPFLADYIINIHHSYLKENTGQIAGYAHKIAEVHGVRHPEVIEIAAIFDRIAADMAAHLREEEDVLFPAIKRIHAAAAAGRTPEHQDRLAIEDSLRKLHGEHETIGDAVHQIRHLTKDYAVPEDACNTFVVTWRKLREFEHDLHKHVHLENNILFAKAAQI